MRTIKGELELLKGNAIYETRLKSYNLMLDQQVAAATDLLRSFEIINWLCVLNTLFFIQHMVTGLYLSLLARFYSASIIQFTDACLAGLSAYYVWYFQKFVKSGMENDALKDGRTLVENMLDAQDFKFGYLFAGILALLVLRLSVALLFNEKIGPLLKILGKMSSDYFSFSAVYGLLVIVFTLFFNLNFMRSESDFESFARSLLTIVDISIGNYALSAFFFGTDQSSSEPDATKNMGIIIMMVAVVFFNMLLINLLVSVLVSTHEAFITKGQGLYLMMILRMRDEQSYDEDYGAFLASMPPLSICQLPFIPITLCLPRGSAFLQSINTNIGRVQYFVFMLLPFTFFLVVSITLIPIAWLISITDKINAINEYKFADKRHLYVDLVVFVFFGPIILALDTLVGDVPYFWVNSFRSDLNKCVIKKSIASVSHRSLKEIMNMANKYVTHKVDTSYAQAVIGNFQRKLKLKQNLQYLIFGQFIPEGGFAQQARNNRGKPAKQQTIKTQNTLDFINQRNG